MNTAATDPTESALDFFLRQSSPVRAILRGQHGARRFPRLDSSRELLTGKSSRRGVPGAFGSNGNHHATPVALA